MGSEREVGVGQDESSRVQSPIHHVFGSITNKFFEFGSSLGVAFKKIKSYLACERLAASLPSARSPGDDISSPSGDFEEESIPPNQDHTIPLGPRIPLVSTNPTDPLHLRFFVRRVRISPRDQVASSNARVVDDAFYIDLESGRYVGNTPSRPDSPLNLGKTFLGVTYQAMYGFLIFHYPAPDSASSKDHHSPKPSHPLLQIAVVNLVVGFAATLIGILLREACPKQSVIIETIGYVSAVIGFFVMMSMLLTDISECIGWICAVGALLAFVIAFIKKNE